MCLVICQVLRVATAARGWRGRQIDKWPRAPRKTGEKVLRGDWKWESLRDDLLEEECVGRKDSWKAFK